MSNCQKIKYCASEILNHIKSKKKVKNQDKIIMLLSKYIDRVIFNFVAIAALISLKAGVKKILDKHMVFIKKYITTLCFSKIKCMSGGSAFNTLAFFGGEEPMYKQENQGSDIMNINFNENLVRPALHSTVNIQDGGAKSRKRSASFKLAKCKKVSGILKVKLAKVFKHFKVKITKASLKVICNKLELFLNSIIIKLIKSKGKELTLSTVKKFMNSKIVKK
tara:strand:+ start:691 stop:1353 length:663 start_codon:yes stop_codon:yes gene_type:complete